MAQLSELNYLFVLTLIFSFLDSYGLGANDVANSFATAVSSRSLSFRQAIVAAGICEFLGAVLVGARVASTIKDSIIPMSNFSSPGQQMLGFTCISAGSSAWQIFATKLNMPVSSTHTIIGAVIGVGVASGGIKSVNWKWDGVSQIFASWGIAPAISAAFSSIVFLITKYLILKRKNSTYLAFLSSPIYFFIVAAILTMSILYKGAASLDVDELPLGTLLGSIFGAGGAIALLSVLFWMPYVHCQVVKNDYTLKLYHIILGPLLWKRPPPSDNENAVAVPDYYKGHRDEDWDNVINNSNNRNEHDANDAEIGIEENKSISAHSATNDHNNDNIINPSPLSDEVEKDITGRPPKPSYRKFEGTWIEPWNLWIILRHNALPALKYYLFGGLQTDIHKMQMSGSQKTQMKLKEMHSKAAQYDNKTEHVFSFLQVMTSCTASFSHGANDVSNAITPLATVYLIWSTSQFAGDKAEIPIWTLVYGGIGIVVGLATYGWKLMSTLGNKLTLHSPSRGFSIELGASITVILAANFGIPVSSTQSIIGSIIGVSFCDGGFKTLNVRSIIFFFFSWCLTLPIAAIIAGCLYGIIINAPSFNPYV